MTTYGIIRTNVRKNWTQIEIIHTHILIWILDQIFNSLAIWVQAKASYEQKLRCSHATKIISLAKGLVSAPYKETKKSKSPKERKEEGWRRGFWPTHSNLFDSVNSEKSGSIQHKGRMSEIQVSSFSLATSVPVTTLFTNYFTQDKEIISRTI